MGNCNTFGKFLKFTTWGESHGSEIGGVLDGVPAGIEMSEDYLQLFLNQRKPASNDFVTPRNEDDRVFIISGVFEGKTTGSPLAFKIFNKDYLSKDYDEVALKYRPSHADYTYHKKYGCYDYRGGGRASARETAMRVVAGAIARKIIPSEVEIKAYISEIGGLTLPNYDSAEYFLLLSEIIQNAKNKGDSVGAVVSCFAKNVQEGLGEPVYDKLNARLAYAMMSIPAVKGVEFGSGFAAARSFGSENNDGLTCLNGKVDFISNNAGGILGGISNGDEIIMRIAFKPTSSISLKQRTITKEGNDSDIVIKGRHDPCVAMRGVYVVKAMMAFTLADFYLIANAYR